MKERILSTTDLNFILDNSFFANERGLIITTQMQYINSAFRPEENGKVFFTTRDRIYIRESNINIFVKECYDQDSFIILTIPKTTPYFDVFVSDTSDYDQNIYRFDVIDSETGEIYCTIENNKSFTPQKKRVKL